MNESSEQPNVLSLNDVCLEGIMKNLGIKNQLKLARTCRRFRIVFQNYVGPFCELMNMEFTTALTEMELKSLLELVGDYVQSLAIPITPLYKVEGYMRLLSKNCPNLRRLQLLLKMSLLEDSVDPSKRDTLSNRERFVAYDDLEELTSMLRDLPRLSARLADFKTLLSLELYTYVGISKSFVLNCCQAMRNLRYLNLQRHPDDLNQKDFRSIMRICPLLERFGFAVRSEFQECECICELSELQHVLIWHHKPLRAELLDALKKKSTKPIQSLILIGPLIPEEQIQDICAISTLRELQLFCQASDIDTLLKLKELQILHITIRAKKEQLKPLVFGFPKLFLLNIWLSEWTMEHYVRDLYVIDARPLKEHHSLHLFIEGYKPDWKILERPDDAANKKVIKILSKPNNWAVLLNTEIIIKDN
ncbi:uncharacterized protein LOC115626341 [Scaptodrosophila lebanonensis]|uniref:Uncharacterized protein LOC115626341 n=1 Tax=Drosophila lebanonensis TaxID=7225 RepID=A0A6J2TND3_DROLE|nr:uncharacterized protein LOC115626341 [Scaptodrosophila lebanonensis]